MNGNTRDLGRSLPAVAAIAIVYGGGELLWFARVGETSLTCIFLAVISGIGAWLLMGKVMPNWPISARLFLLLAIAVFANATMDIRLRENLAQYQTLDAGSDDSFYLESAGILAQNISASSGLESYWQTFMDLPRSPHLGFIVALGHLFTLVPESEASQIRLIFLLNLFALQMIAALIAAEARIDYRRYAGFTALYLAAGYDLFFFGAEVRKDVWVTFCLLVVICALHRLTGSKKKGRSLALIAVFGLALYFLRNFYCVFPLAGVAIARLRFRYNAAEATAWVTAAVVASVPIAWFVRQSEWFAAALATFRSEGTAGITAAGVGAQIYNLPVIGPLLYGAITPLPPTPMQFLGNPLWTSAWRGAGTILVLVIVFKACAKALRLSSRLDPAWWSFVFVGLMAFVCASYASTEARHKLASIPCLLICYYALDAERAPVRRRIVQVTMRSAATLHGGLRPRLAAR